MLWLTAGLFHQVVQDGARELAQVRQLLAGGETLSVSAVSAVLRCGGPGRLINGYGPTEGTTFSACHAITNERDIRCTVPIGRPIANAQCYVLDERLEPAAIGVVGELYVSGAGLARGYLNRAGLTAQRFIAHPYGCGERLYRTGDRVRCRADGNLEYLGRMDQQVKIRGYRIEPGEIEAVLLQQPGVRQAVVVVREEEGEKSLVGYVAADRERLSDAEAGRLTGQVVKEWEQLYEQTYEGSGAEGEPGFVGWNSSYTEIAIARNQMEEWLSGTVRRISRMGGKRILEIGCGVGLLVKELAAGCEEYVGTDVSGRAIKQLGEWIRTRWPERLDRIRLLQGGAHDLQRLLQGQRAGFDGVVLNSVAQYFPNERYLRHALRLALQQVRPGGYVFIGDVRHLGLLEVFHSAVQAHRSDGEQRVGILRERIAQAMSQEKELLIEPRYFEELRQSLPVIEAVQIQLKEGCSGNELMRYRYDVWLRLAQGECEAAAETLIESAPDLLRLNWREIGSLQKLREVLSSRGAAMVRVEEVGNERLREDFQLMRAVWEADSQQSVRSLLQPLPQQNEGPERESGQEPADFWDLGQQYGYEARVTWNAHSTRHFDVQFIDPARVRPAGLGTDVGRGAAPPPPSYVNDPVSRLIDQCLMSDLRERLKGRLPEYMVPTDWVILDQLPLNENGKVDRRALPRPARRTGASEYVPPRTAVEQALARIWAEVLRLDRVGVEDNFFELGGHSLLGMRLVTHIRSVLQVEVPLRALFENPTIAQLTCSLSGALRHEILERANRYNAIADRLRNKIKQMSKEEIQLALQTYERHGP